MLTELLEIVEDRKINFIYNGRNFNKLEIIEDDPKCGFRIEESDGDINISVDPDIVIAPINKTEGTMRIPKRTLF